MSGVAGVWCPSMPGLARQSIGEAMTERILYRGEPAYLGASVPGLTIAQLHSAGFSRGEGPGVFENDRLAVAVDGSVYGVDPAACNEAAALQVQPEAFAVAALYEDDPDAFPRGLDGSCNVVLYDKQRRRLNLASDPLGTRPFYYAFDHEARRFSFASEIKALLAAGIPREINLDAVGIFLVQGSIPAPYSAFQRVAKLLPGEVLRVEADGSHENRCFWRLPQQAKGPETVEAWKEPVREQMNRTLDRVLGNTNRVGFFAGGGLDSSLGLAAIRHHGRAEAVSLSVAFSGAKHDDDGAWAGRIAGELGVTHRLVNPGPEEVSEERCLTVLRQFDDLADPARALSQSFLSEAAAEAGLNACLNGLNGEATFGRSASWLAGAAEGMEPRARVEGLFAGEPFFSFGGLDILADEKRGGVDWPAHRMAVMAERLPLGDWFGFLLASVVLGSQYHRIGIHNHLVSPRFGLEVRSLYTDLSLIEFVSGIPDSLRGAAALDQSRATLTAAYRELAPSLLQPRPKRVLPRVPWTRPEYSHIEKLVLERVHALKERAFIRPQKVDRLLNHFHARGRRRKEAAKLWLLFSLELWLETYAG